MKKSGLFVKIVAAIIAICMIAALILAGIGEVTADAATSAVKNCPPNLRPALFPGRTYISMKGNAASKTVTFCQPFYHNGKVKVRVDDPSVASVSYKYAGKAKSARYYFIAVKFKKLDDVMVYFNSVMEDFEMSLPIIASNYKGDIKSFKIGSKKYTASKSFSFVGESFKSKKVTVTPKKGLKVDFLYVVDNYEKVKKGTNEYTVKKKYKNGTKVTVPAGCALHVVFKTTSPQVIPDFCIYTANGSTGSTGGSSSNTNKSSSTKSDSSGKKSSSSASSSNNGNTTTFSTSAKLKITKVTPMEFGTGSYGVDWQMMSGATGYELLTALDKNFTKGTYSLVYKNQVNGGGMTGFPSSIKTVYFKVRAIKEVNGKKQYSKWSDVKSVKVN